MLTYDDKRIIVPIVLSVIGLLMFIIGGFFAIKVIFFDIRGKSKVNGVITNLTNDSTTVSYVVNNREYRKFFSVYLDYTKKSIGNYANK